MAFDAHTNLAVANVVTAPSPPTSGTSLVISAGLGANLPAVPFNATVWPTGQLPTRANAELVRVTARSTDTLTLTRAQEGTTARSIVAGDLFAATISVKSLTDIESGTNFPQIATGAISGTTGAFSGDVQLSNSPTAQITTTTSAQKLFFNANSSYWAFYGNTYGSGLSGAVNIAAGNVSTGVIDLRTGADVVRQRVYNDGAISFGNNPQDYGVNEVWSTGKIRAGADIVMHGTAPQAIVPATSAGTTQLGSYSVSGGVQINGITNATNPGGVLVFTGNHATASIELAIGSVRQKLHASGGISFGSVGDPGAGNYYFNGNVDTAGSISLRGVTLTAERLARLLTLEDRVVALETLLKKG